MLNKHIKTIFPSEWFHFKITFAEETESDIKLTFTCDVGDRAYQHIVMKFDRETQVHMIDKLCEGLGFVPIGSIKDDYFSLQFVGLRCRAMSQVVAKDYDAVFLTNILVEWQLPTIPPDWDVSKPKKDDYFFEGKNKKKLPL
jgi:hypothetical protein